MMVGSWTTFSFFLEGGEIFRGKMLNFWMYYRIYPEKHVRKGRISTVSVIRVIRFPRFVHWLTEKQQWAERSSVMEPIRWRGSLKPVFFLKKMHGNFGAQEILGMKRWFGNILLWHAGGIAKVCWVFVATWFVGSKCWDPQFGVPTSAMVGFHYIMRCCRCSVSRDVLWAKRSNHV